VEKKSKHWLFMAPLFMSLLFGAQSEAASSDPCRVPAQQNLGQIEHCFSPEAGLKRSFFVSLPENYNASKAYKLLIVFPGTDTTGEQMQEYIGQDWNEDVAGLEGEMKDTILVYPDPKWRKFEAFGDTREGEELGGWLLGPYGRQAKGMEDLNFTGELLDLLQKNYRIDSKRIFVTGHSWGGDMAAVVGCFLGDRVRAVAPVAANDPYWFNTGGAPLNCKGSVAVWTFFGLDDKAFNESAKYDGEFGQRQADHWQKINQCQNGEAVVEGVSQGDETVEYQNCKQPVRLTLYRDSYPGGGEESGHQPPAYFMKTVSEWFSQF